MQKRKDRCCGKRLIIMMNYKKNKKIRQPLGTAAICDISTGQNTKQTHKGKTGHGIAIMRHTANSDKRSGDTSGQTGMSDAKIKKICF